MKQRATLYIDIETLNDLKGTILYTQFREAFKGYRIIIIR